VTKAAKVTKAGLGGSASVATAWVAQRTLNKRKEFRVELTKRETLYGQFINECSARALPKIVHFLRWRACGTAGTNLPRESIGGHLFDGRGEAGKHRNTLRPCRPGSRKGEVWRVYRRC
jgi:hypothetical protein